jgi:hypothetical protein
MVVRYGWRVLNAQVIVKYVVNYVLPKLFQGHVENLLFGPWKMPFCGVCTRACPSQAILRTGDYRMATRQREDLLLVSPGKEEIRLASALESKMLKMFGRSLKLRQVSAGGCNACEAISTCWVP